MRTPPKVAPPAPPKDPSVEDVSVSTSVKSEIDLSTKTTTTTTITTTTTVHAPVEIKAAAGSNPSIPSSLPKVVHFFISSMLL